MTLFYLVQHGAKEARPGDPGLTAAGWEQAGRAARRLRPAGVAAVFSSPLRRAHETAQVVAEAAAVPVTTDERLRERMNWDGRQDAEEFFEQWQATVADRDFVPALGDSSRAAGARFLAFLAEHAADPGPVAVATHGGVTVDLLRTLLGDDAVPAHLWQGVPGCAVTTLDGLEVVEIASVAHLE
jgi:broad specificity phosphatase PhoE